MQTKIKICGITDSKIAGQLAHYPIDAIGLVFYEKSPRFVDINKANDIIAALPPFINRVGLFVNAKANFIANILAKVALDTLQFHGDENPRECSCYHLPFIKAIKVNSDTNLNEIADNYHQASALLLDSDSSIYGGSGRVFDWSLVDRKLVDISLPIILAGGLNSSNVSDAIDKVRPYAVDVSSGVETSAGVKDLTKIGQFINQVYGV